MDTQPQPVIPPTEIYGYRQGFAVAAADMAARIGLVDLINAQVPWDPRQCKVSPGVRILALVIGMLVDPLALYRLEELYADMDCAVLFGAERQAHDFNDDAMGRALRKLFDCQVGQLYETLGQQAVERLELPATATAHADTTTVTLYGEYPDPWTGSLPARGYHKDGHPECKQLVAGVVARADGIPIAVDVLDGNTDDTTWSREALLGRAVDPHEHILFVADSKAVTHTTVADLCDGNVRFVSRLPNTFGLEQVTKAAAAAADPRAWDMVGRLSSRTDAATYRVWPTTGTLGEQPVRLIVVHSSALEAKATRQLADRQDKEAQQLDRELRRWETRHFACAADAEAAWTAWRESPTVIRAVWAVHGEMIEEIDREGPAWRVHATRGELRAEQIAAEQFRRSTFILVSNDPRRTARELLEAYKTQFVVEQDHAVLKGPLTVAPLFLKDTGKITAYVYVVYMALLLWQCMQAVMRQNQTRLGISLPYPNKALQPAPTTKRLKEILSPIQVIHWRDATGQLRRSRSELSLVQRQALLLLGMDSRRFTQIPSG
jgi:transposase